ncbi:MAG: hypothetical protein ABSB53_03835 [Nitrososphaerales archaeon]
MQQSQDLYFPPNTRAFFLTYLLLFIIYAVIAYTRVMVGHRRRNRDCRDVAILFGLLMSVLMSATLSPSTFIPYADTFQTFVILFLVLDTLLFFTMTSLVNPIWPAKTPKK